MTVMYTKMVSCLQSDKTMGDCQVEMMKSCYDGNGRYERSDEGDERAGKRN